MVSSSISQMTPGEPIDIHFGGCLSCKIISSPGFLAGPLGDLPANRITKIFQYPVQVSAMVKDHLEVFREVFGCALPWVLCDGCLNFESHDHKCCRGALSPINVGSHLKRAAQTASLPPCTQGPPDFSQPCHIGWADASVYDGPAMYNPPRNGREHVDSGYKYVPLHLNLRSRKPESKFPPNRVSGWLVSSGRSLWPTTTTSTTNLCWSGQMTWHDHHCKADWQASNCKGA
ncbi:predicted protein [Uncinocarpus reesii 1704]|uniref:Uncharacterized protein n=1 Tax=Uncinocarpus reesii (strain UAMH 1704) TaxID=336963 RepID=C4JJK3_UNCRE|nr:uncharacterized protein UREG_01810 [Uncinocarpus reesii 1704]EEP76961.1 predicted protein [Uncinocarpus reesii 1704]